MQRSKYQKPPNRSLISISKFGEKKHQICLYYIFKYFIVLIWKLGLKLLVKDMSFDFVYFLALYVRACVYMHFSLKAGK